MQPLSQLRRKRRSLASDGRGPILLAIAGGWFLSIGVRMVYPVMLPHMRAVYGFDLSLAGVLLTVLFMAYAAGQVPAGVLADRIGEGRILVVSCLLSAATLSVLVLGRSLPMLFVSTALFGTAIALYGVARFTALADVFPEQFGTVTGLTSSASEAGQSLLPALAGVIAAVTTWKVGFGAAIPLFGLAAIALWLFVPARTSSTAVTETLSPDLLRYVGGAIRRQAVWQGALLLCLGVAIWQAFTGFYPTYLIEVKGLSPSVAAGLFGLFFGIGIVVHPVAGTVYDAAGIKPAIIGTVGIGGASLTALSLLEGVWSLVLVTVTTAPLLGFATVTQSYLVDSLPADIQGTGFGIVRSVSFGLGALSPVVFGVVADRGYFDEAFVGLTVIAGAILLLVLRLPASDRA